jgi:hypothetical protein
MEERMAKIEKAETYVIPHYLYRYRLLQHLNREMNCIKQAHLFCTNFRQMNDPMEVFYSESKLLNRYCWVAANGNTEGPQDGIIHEIVKNSVPPRARLKLWNFYHV